MSTNNNLLLDAISTNNIPALRALFDEQDRQLYAQVAQTGSLETAANLLSRHQTPTDECPQFLPNRIQPSTQPSISSGNLHATPTSLYPAISWMSVPRSFSLPKNISATSKNFLVNAIDGVVNIWEIILECDAKWMDYGFRGHHGCVLEGVVMSRKKDLLEMIMKKGADMMREGNPVLELARYSRVDRDMLELIMKYDPRWMKFRGSEWWGEKEVFYFCCC